MTTWLGYLQQGLARTLPADRLAEHTPIADARAHLGNLRPFVARHWKQGAFGATLILANSLLAFPSPLVNRFLIDDVILGRQLDLLPIAVVLFAGAQGAGMLTGILQQFYFTRFEQHVLLDIQSDLLDRTLRFPKAFFDEKEIGYLMSRLLSDVQGLRWFFSSTLVYIATNILRFLGGVAFLFYLEWQLALVTLVALPGLALAVRYFSGKMRVLSHASMERQANVTRTLQESLSAATLIKTFASEKRTVARVMEQLDAARQLALEQLTVGAVANLAIGVLPDVARGVVLVAGAIWVIQGQWTLGSLLAFQAYLGFVYGPALFLASANLQLQNALAALERVATLFDIVPEENLGVGKPVARLRGGIEFRNVTFAYSGGEPVLADVSFRVAPGERLALVGPSGVGKTTLLSLLLRFYQPTRGEIFFDGAPAGAYELGSLRGRIGYVAQSATLLAGTLLDNLRYGNLTASEAQVIHAAQIAGIHEFIASLPAGYQSPVGERGVNLSEGQKQRLTLARALIQDPDILILDEPTAALDGVTEKTIFDALPARTRGKTLLVVAHRLATIQNADRILVLNEKHLIATGTHAELLAHSDLYRALVASQYIDAGVSAA